jgi:hypothetical protein
MAEAIRQKIMDLLAVEPQTSVTERQIAFLERDLARLEQGSSNLLI